MTDRPDPPPWLAEAQRPPAAVPPDADRPAPLLFDAEHRPITSPDAWARRRLELRGAWGAFLGEIEGVGPVPRMEVLRREVVGPEADGEPAVERSLVRYESEPGHVVEAYLLRPDGPAPTGGRPGAVVLHSTVDSTIRQPAGLEGPADKRLSGKCPQP